MFDVVVVGGGFRGLLCAYLAKKKNLSVAIVERAETLGGFLNSFSWHDYLVDRGVQLFNSVPSELKDIIVNDIGIDVEPITFKYGSVYDGEVTPGFALPNYSSVTRQTKEKILYELVERIGAENNTSDNFKQFLVDRYGPTATSCIEASFKNIYRIEVAETDTSALTQTAFHRLYFVDDDTALKLKKHPDIDKKIAARRSAMGKVDDFVSFYPKTGAMCGIAKGFEKKIREMGCKVFSSFEIKKIENLNSDVHNAVKIIGDDADILAKKIIWSSPVSQLEKCLNGTSAIAGLEHWTPMVSFVFELDSNEVNDYTYFHQFSANTHVFRSSAMGVYSSQYNSQGNTFVTAECPTDIGSKFWEKPEHYLDEIWSELVQMKLVTASAPTPNNYNFVRLNKTHIIPKVGHTAALNKFIENVESKFPNIITEGYKAFLRRDIFISSKKLIDGLAR